MARKVIDRKGERYGKLIVIAFHELKKTKAYWKCKCDCGNETIARSDKLKSGTKKSCGCLSKEVSRNNMNKIRKSIPPINGEHHNPRNNKHGLHNTRFYNIWRGMKERCFNERNKDFHHYGGRGIDVWERWLEFNNFKDDMYKEYLSHSIKHGERNTSIDRIEVNGNYELSNCRWATWKIQANNQRDKAKRFEYRGEKYTVKELSNKYNLSVNVINNRLNYGWSIEKIINKPVRKKKRNKLIS